MRTERQPIILDPAKYNDPLVHRSWDDFGEDRPPVRAVRVPLCYEYFVGWDHYQNQFWNTVITCMRCLVMNSRTAVATLPPKSPDVG